MKFSVKSNFTALAVTIAVNAVANILPLGGRTTGQVSAGYNIMLTPAPVTFSIWSVIYTLLIAVFVIELVRPEQGETESRILGGYFMLNCVGNSVWIISWHLLPVQVSFFVILVILYSLYGIFRNSTTDGDSPGRIFKIAFSVYFGWILVATLVNFCVFCYSLGAIKAFSENSAVTVAFIILAAIIALYALFMKKLPFFAYTVAWALLGIFIKLKDTYTVPAVVALVSCIAVACPALIKQLFGKCSDRSRKQ